MKDPELGMFHVYVLDVEVSWGNSMYFRGKPQAKAFSILSEELGTGA